MPIAPEVISLLTAAVAGGVAALTFFLGRLSAARSGGQKWGELLMDVKYIKVSVERLEKNQDKEISQLKSQMDEKFKVHLATWHGRGDGA